jgi:hypothetical protein
VPSHAPRSLAPIKQQETLAKFEARLRHALASSAPEDKVAMAAERVRKSQLSILKARRELLRYKTDTPEKLRQLESITATTEWWTSLSAQEIAKRYGVSGDGEVIATSTT